MADKKTDEDKIFAFLCYLLPIIGSVIVLATKSERSPFSIYHAKQGLVLGIFWIIVVIIYSIFVWFLWWIAWILWILVAILWIIGVINSLTGKMKPLPVIGSFGEKFKF